MSSPTSEQVRKSIEPKSDQLNADDLLTGPLTVTITGVKEGDTQQPIVVEIEGHRPYKPCKSMRRVLIAVYGDTPANWIGQRLTLFNDPDVLYAGVKHGGIRISHMSGIDKPTSFLLTARRGVKTESIIQPVATIADRVSAAVTAYQTCDTEARLMKLDSRIDALVHECDGEQQALISAARDAAIERVNRSSE